MDRRLLRVCIAVWIVGVASTASAQTVTWHRFDPLVVPSTFTGQVRLEAAVTGPPTRVALALDSGQTIDMRDDGTGGDARAGDGVFTASLPAAAILTALRADDVQRYFVGFLDVFIGTTRVLRGNMFVDVYSPALGTFAIDRLASDAQATARVLNIVDPLYLSDGDVRRLASRFYRYYGDSYDFLNIISTPSRFQNRTHSIVRNDVDGIGLQRVDNSAQYGSAGRLRGITLFPIPGFFDGADTGFSHETGHQWINHLNFAPFATGVPHWPVSSMATGTMGFSIGGGGGEGGDFRCNVVDDGTTVRLLPVASGAPTAFNDFDLYLMGLLPPEEVRAQVVLTGVTSPPPCNGQPYGGTVTRVTANSIVSTAGRRVPDSTASPKRFRAATILVSRDGPVSDETMWLYSWFAARAELETAVPIHSGFTKRSGNPFFAATGGRATVDTLLSSEPDFSLQAAQAAVTVTRGAAATFRISALPTRTAFDQPVTFACGTVPAPLVCSFTPDAVTPGTSGADVTLTVTTGTAAAIAWPLGLVLIAAAATRRARGARRLAFAAAAMLVTACGGGSTPPTTPTNPGTGSAVYTITVTGTSGAVTHSTLLTLTVR
jgi:hypothetical protein